MSLISKSLWMYYFRERLNFINNNPSKYRFQLNIGIPSLTKCCNQHDRCYETCGKSKNDCDEAFQSCLSKICRDVQKTLGLAQHVQGKADFMPWGWACVSIRFGEGNGTPLQYSCLENPMDGGAWWAAVHGVTKSWTWLSDFPFTFHFHALEKEMATHSSVLSWRIPGTGEPGGLPSMGSHRVGHDWSDLAAAAVSDLLTEISHSVLPYLLWHSPINFPRWFCHLKWFTVMKQKVVGNLGSRVCETVKNSSKILCPVVQS